MALRDTLFLGGKVIDVAVNRAGPKVLTTRLLRIVKVPRPLPRTGSSIQWLLTHVLRHADGKGGSVSNLFYKMIYMYMYFESVEEEKCILSQYAICKL